MYHVSPDIFPDTTRLPEIVPPALGSAASAVTPSAATSRPSKVELVVMAPVIAPPLSGRAAPEAPSTYALVARSWAAVGLPAPVILDVPMAIAPDIVPPAKGSFAAIELVTVVLKLASSPKAAASSLSVFNDAGELSTRLLTAVSA